MSQKKRWLWIMLFVLAVLLLGSLATGWNWVVIQNYLKNAELRHTDENPWLPITLGSLGFLTLLGGLVLFFTRLLREMRLTQFQSEFLAAVSHELKTPISTLELTSSLLRQSGASEEEKNRLWDAHQAELKRLRQDVEAVLEAMRWEAGPIPLEIQKIDLESWIREQWSRWTQILGPDAKLEHIKKNSAPIWIESDTKQLSLVFHNLIENSKKFARGYPHIEIGTELSNHHWKITLRDYGWGVPEKDLRKIFKRFYRSKNAAPYSISGTGLGLHLVASACKAMKMQIEAELPDDQKSGIRFILQGESVHDV